MDMEGCMVQRIANILSILVLLTLIATPVMGAALPPVPRLKESVTRMTGKSTSPPRTQLTSPRLQ